MWAFGGAIETLIASQTSIGLKADYLVLDDADVNGFDASRLLDQTEALRVQAKLSYRPQFNLPGLESLRF